MATLELILMLAAAVLVSSVLEQVLPRISLPLIQIALGFLLALFSATTIDITLDPDFFLLLFIAPLLFNDAKNADKLGLWRNKKTILSLAVGLVLIIMLAVGFSVHWLIPSIPLTAAFALGAALGPTDAVAVSSLSRTVDLSRREKALLSGEALLNDASGVVSFQFAIAAAVTGAFSLLDASVSFVFSFFGGIIAGILLALIAHWIQGKVRDLGLESTTFFVMFDVLLPFIIYLCAEVISVSGILAVVAAGLVISSYSDRKIGPTASRLSIVSSSVWRVISFALNGIVFVMLGMQLPRATQSTWDSVAIDNIGLIGFVLAITVVLVVVRFVWVTAMNVVSRHRSEGRGWRISGSDLRSDLIATVGGPKGAVTLSIIFSIPLFTDSGLAFPQRDLIIFLASGVILCTLLLANFLLPVLAPPTPEADIDTDEEAARVQVDIFRRVIEQLAAEKTAENGRAVDAVIGQYNDRILAVQEKADIESEPTSRLKIDVLRCMQDYVVELVERGEADDLDGYTYIHRLGERQNFVRHKSSSRWMARQAMAHFKTTVNVLVRMVLKALPGVDEPQHTNEMRQLQIATEQHAVEHLQQMLDSKDSVYPTEVVAQSLLFHQAALSRLERTRPDITSYARTTDKMDDVERRAYAFEIEGIQDAYEAGTLKRAQAKEMRDNVLLMQLDLEDHV